MKKILILILFFVAVFGQNTKKKNLSIDDFPTWKRVSNTIISNDGKYIFFEINPQKGDGVLLLKNNKGELISEFPRGYDAKYSENGLFVFKIKQPADSIRKAKLKKVDKKKMPMDSLGVFSIKENNLVKFPDVKNYNISEENSDWVAFTVKAEKKKTTDDDKKEKKKEKPKKKEKKHGDLLFIYNLSKNDTIKVNNVTEFESSKKGKVISFISHFEDSLFRSEVKSFDTKNEEIKNVYTEVGKAIKLTLDESGYKNAFLFSADTTKEKVYSLNYSNEFRKPNVLVNCETENMPENCSVSKNGKLNFSENGEKIYFGIAPKPEKEESDSLLDDEKPKLDIWSWTDIEVIPEQRLKAKREKKRTYKSVYFISKNKFAQLADEEVRDVRIFDKGDADFALGINDRPYKKSSSWNARWHSDYYYISIKNGKRTKLVSNKSYAQLSPDGNYIVWYDFADSNYYARKTKSDKSEIINLTNSISVDFYDVTHDQPSDPRNYGIAGWSDDNEVFIYDRYDIWKIDLSGKEKAVNVTNGFGRKNEIEFRYRKLNSDLKYLTEDGNPILIGFENDTKAYNVYTCDFSKKTNPAKIIGGEYRFSRFQKAKNANQIVFTKENVKVYPDVLTSNLSFDNPIRLSDANPQQKDFNWVTVEKIKWKSFTGETLEGLVYKPENFDPNKKYPVVVYFYEISSNRMHSYSIPSPSRSIINKSFYPSNDYIVFVPDITYKVGYPGQSAYNAIVSGTNYLMVKYPWIDKDKIALQGQSWGGYQTAYLVTQTDMFACAMGGAVVSNMTSAYGGIRWGSGLARTFQYEHTQSRIGGSLWEKLPLYLENSPLFHAPKINTPLMLMHNDNDGAVPWYQGIEMFLAMRRLNKPCWMVNYNGEPHNLKASSWANRMDLSKRMKQFFDHYLKNAPMPEWMEKGIPYVEKGKNLGFELTK